MKVYWSRCGHGHGNFGDKITPLLLQHFGVRCEWAPPERAELIGVGSVLEKLPDNFKGIVWTSGFMREESRKELPRANVLAVRGKLTLERLDCPHRESVRLGDAGLLCNLFHKPRAKRFKLGIIPHFVDADDPVVAALAKSSSEITVIDICGETLDVIARVAECEHIVSSSLHGLILADSLGIPNRWIELNRGAERVAGDGFKYRDYYSIFSSPAPAPDALRPADNLHSILAHLGTYSRLGLAAIKQQLLQSIAEIIGREPRFDTDEIRRERKHRTEWSNRLRHVRHLLETTLPPESSVAIADEDQLRSELQFQRVLPFTERNGEYWGPPPDDESAIGELTRLHQQRVEFFALTFPSFWLLEHYGAFAKHLRAGFPCVLQHDDVMVFRLSSQQSQR